MIENRKILSISPFVPWPFLHGAVTRIHYLNKWLGARNRLFFVHRRGGGRLPPDFPAVSVPLGSRRWSQVLSPKLIRVCRGIARREGIEIILANHLWSGLHGLILRRLTGLPLVFDDHNVEYLRFRRTKSRIWPLIRSLEKTVCRGADRVLCVSGTDRDFLVEGLALPADKLRVVENGVDFGDPSTPPPDRAEERGALGVPPGETLLLFYGSFTYTPNIEAIRIILREIHPRLVARGMTGRIALVGGPMPPGIDLGSLRTSPLEVHAPGFAEDVSTWNRCADLMIAPIVSGSGTRLKILECLARGTPVVSTAIGAEGLDLDACGENLVLSDDWDDFAEKVRQLADRSPTPVPRRFVERYDWRSIVEGIDAP